MKIKSKASDFVVVERLDDAYLRERGAHRVYRVTKRKLTSLEAARALADEAGVPAGDIGLAGLKDRQGVTTQFMSVHHGRPVFIKLPDLRIETAGFAEEQLSSRHSVGNSFEITVRGLERGDREAIEERLGDVRDHGIPNYFGEQRFGNLEHGQGWVARELAFGRHEKALFMLLAGASDEDNERNARFKKGLDARWGDWRACRDLGGRFGAHISVFEHLARNDGDFAGAFRFVASRVRLIHLYAWQSHVWNRALARLVDHAVPKERRFAIQSVEGPLVFHTRGPLELDPSMRGLLRLPGEGLEDVEHPFQRDLLALALRDQGLQPGDFRIQGVPGFQLKGEDRPILVWPRHLEIRPARRDDAPDTLITRFELPRGAYATLVLARLVPGGVHTPREGGPRAKDAGPRGAHRTDMRVGPGPRHREPAPPAEARAAPGPRGAQDGERSGGEARVPFTRGPRRNVIRKARAKLAGKPRFKKSESPKKRGKKKQS